MSTRLIMVQAASIQELEHQMRTARDKLAAARREVQRLNAEYAALMEKHTGRSEGVRSDYFRLNWYTSSGTLDAQAIANHFRVPVSLIRSFRRRGTNRIAISTCRPLTFKSLEQYKKAGRIISVR